jgi:hypothetical protein
MKRRVHLIFPKDLVQKPLTWELSKKFDIVFNVRRAKITETAGESVLELEGRRRPARRRHRLAQKPGGQSGIRDPRHAGGLTAFAAVPGPNLPLPHDRPGGEES